MAYFALWYMYVQHKLPLASRVIVSLFTLKAIYIYIQLNMQTYA